ncbi:MAG: flippase-like domain-containing protein [Candidatus Omnitrophica bacterium]|nr:flippase-like domain-containing protein [Candidatus Omnitrophota bacterium]
MKIDRGWVLRAGISLLALGGLGYFLRDKLEAALLILRHGLQWEWFLAAIGAYGLAIAITSKRLQMIFHVQKVKVSFLQTVHLTFLGLFFTLFLPSALGGDIAKGYFAFQYSGKKLGSFTGVVLDRMVGFISLFPIVLTALAVYGKTLATPAVERSVIGALAVFLFAGLFFSSRRFAKKFGVLSFLIPSKEWRQKLSDLYHAIRGYRNHKGIFAGCFVISIVSQLIFIWDVYLLARSLGIEASPWPFFVMVPLVGFVSLAPSVSGLGVREAGFVFFFKSIMPAEKALALSILYDILFYGVALAAGLLFAFKGGLRKNVIHDLEAAAKLQEA